MHGKSMEGLKTIFKNTCEGVHLLVKLPATSLQILLKMNFLTHIFQ